jgi:hypothetical protein
VAPAGRHVRERSTRRHPEQLAFRVELFEHWVEVALVDAAPVEQDQRPIGLTGRLAVEMDQLDDLARAVLRRVRR